jgi:hypothetical protein
VHPGQSQVRAHAFGVALGVSTENMWWGPGIRNSIIMSNTAGGFPHVFAGTSGPANVGIGSLEAQAVWGRLEQSAYFELDVPAARQLLTGIAVGFQPRGMPGLVLGATRMFNLLIPDGGLEGSDYFPFLQRLLKRSLKTDLNPTGDTPTDEMASVFFRWVLPASGFEVYGEFARTDHNLDFHDLVSEPDHSRAYALGLQKVTELRRGRWLRLGGEVTNLGDPRVSTYRTAGGSVRWYAHDQAYLGHTHRGQLLCAGIGPGSDTQALWADVYGARGRIGVFGERTRYDDDAYFRHFARVYSFTGHDVELSTGVSQTLFLGPLDLEWALALNDRRNRNFLVCNDRGGAPQRCPSDREREQNWQLRLHATWWPHLTLSPRPRSTEH